MIALTQNARGQFLEAAARAYVGIDPATSAYLMARRNLGATQDVKGVSGNGSSPSCRACGTTMLPGRTSSISISDESLARQWKSKTKSIGIERQLKKKSILIKCMTCHYYVKATLPPPQKSKDTASVVEVAPLKANATGKNPSTGNAGSKQRARARKGGLQAMLEKSKQGSISTRESGLGLMDFLTQG